MPYAALSLRYQSRPASVTVQYNRYACNASIYTGLLQVLHRSVYSRPEQIALHEQDLRHRWYRIVNEKNGVEYMLVVGLYFTGIIHSVHGGIPGCRTKSFTRRRAPLRGSFFCVSREKGMFEPQQQPQTINQKP
jgi:hypothetical protein